MKRSRRHRQSARAGRPRPWHAVAIVLLGLGATLASSTVKQATVARHADIEGCSAGCPVAAAGWPLPYLVDKPGRSPANEASLSGAVAGADRWRPEALALDLGAWTALFAIAYALLRRLRR